MNENDEPCMCGTPFTCLADEHDHAVATISITAHTCPLSHRDPDGWRIDERPHLAARPPVDG